MPLGVRLTSAGGLGRLAARKPVVDPSSSQNNHRVHAQTLQAPSAKQRNQNVSKSTGLPQVEDAEPTTMPIKVCDPDLSCMKPLAHIPCVECRISATWLRLNHHGRQEVCRFCSAALAFHLIMVACSQVSSHPSFRAFWMLPCQSVSRH